MLAAVRSAADELIPAMRSAMPNSVRYDGQMLLVDGYNITMRDAETGALSKEGQRDALVARLAAHAAALAPDGDPIVVVFDAHGQLGVSSGRPIGRVKAVYAASADDEIVRRCAGAGGRVTVATDDLRLRARISQDVGRHVRFVDGAALSTEGIALRRSKAGARAVARDEGLPPGANRITEELKALWLSEEDSREG